MSLFFGRSHNELRSAASTGTAGRKLQDFKIYGWELASCNIDLSWFSYIFEFGSGFPFFMQFWTSLIEPYSTDRKLQQHPPDGRLSWSQMRGGDFSEAMSIELGNSKNRTIWPSGCFLKWWYPQNNPKWSFLVGKPVVVGYHHFRKHPSSRVQLGTLWSCRSARESICNQFFFPKQHCFSHFSKAVSNYTPCNTNLHTNHKASNGIQRFWGSNQPINSLPFSISHLPPIQNLHDPRSGLHHTRIAGVYDWPLWTLSPWLSGRWSIEGHVIHSPQESCYPGNLVFLTSLISHELMLAMWKRHRTSGK